MKSALGKIKVDVDKRRIAVELNEDFIRYYLWFIKKAYWVDLHTPMYGAHITIANFKLHSNVDYNKAKKLYDGKIVAFEYDVNPVRGGLTKGFLMFYLHVFSKQIEAIKDDLKIVERANYKGMHITLGTNKNGDRPYWPQMITIK
jgi:hypothetical protein